MGTWPELLAHLKDMRKLILKHQGSKRKELERRLGQLQAQARKMSSRELDAAKDHPKKKPARPGTGLRSCQLAIGQPNAARVRAATASSKVGL